MSICSIFKPTKRVEGRIVHRELTSTVNGLDAQRCYDQINMGLPERQARINTGYVEKPVTLYVIKEKNGKFHPCGRRGHYTDLERGDYVEGTIVKHLIAYSNIPVDVTRSSRRHGLHLARDVRRSRNYYALRDFSKIDPKTAYLRDDLLPEMLRIGSEYTWRKMKIGYVKDMLRKRCQRRKT